MNHMMSLQGGFPWMCVEVLSNSGWRTEVFCVLCESLGFSFIDGSDVMKKKELPVAWRILYKNKRVPTWSVLRSKGQLLYFLFLSTPVCFILTLQMNCTWVYLSLILFAEF